MSLVLNSLSDTFLLDNDTTRYQNPFTIHVKHTNYDADDEKEILPENWIDYDDSHDDSKFFIFELDL